MESCLGIMSTNDIEKNFGTLCKNRPVYMLPFGGRYRLVDFALSNMVNNGIRTVAVYTGEKIKSTMDHLGNGKPWDLNRRVNGLFLFPPIRDDSYKKGDISEYFSTEEFFEQATEKYVLIVHPNIISKVNFRDAYRYFRDTDADATLIYKKQSDFGGLMTNSDKLYLNKDGSLQNIGLNLGTENEFNLYLGMAFIKKEVFMNLVKSSIEKGDTNYFKQAGFIKQ